VPVPVKWKDHDLQYRPTFDMYVGIRSGEKGLFEQIGDVEHQFGTEAGEVMNQYQKVWYHRLLAQTLLDGALGAAGIPPETISTAAQWVDVHLRMRELIIGLSALTQAGWQFVVSRDFLATREGMILHDHTIFGRNERYAGPRDQSLILPMM
jgi:hypothetical protein